MRAQLYKWKDKDGKMHFSTNRANVPKEYRSQLKQLSRGRSSAIASQRETVVIKYPPGAKEIFLNVTLNGEHKVRFLLDTGATISAIKPSLADLLKPDPSKMSKTRIGTAGGIVETPVMQMDSIELEGKKIEQVPVAIMEALEGHRGTDGLLGMDFFNNFDYSLRPAKGELIIRPKK